MYRPDVCHGIGQVPTPFSIALIIWAVTVAYTCLRSDEICSCPDIDSGGVGCAALHDLRSIRFSYEMPELHRASSRLALLSRVSAAL